MNSIPIKKNIIAGAVVFWMFYTKNAKGILSLRILANVQNNMNNVTKTDEKE